MLARQKKYYYIYIDINSLVAVRFDLSHYSLHLIQKGVQEKKLIVLTNKIFKGEFIKHCNKILNEEKQSLKKQKPAIRYKLKDELDDLLNKFELLSGEEYYSDFLEKFECKNIDCEIRWEIIFEKYFDGIPPFLSKNKKNEFPDAFVMEMLEPYSSKLLIISNDADFKSWINAFHREEIKLFKSLSDFSHFYIINAIDDKTVSNMVELYLDKKKEIKEKAEKHILNYFDDTAFFELHNDYVAEVDAESVEIKLCGKRFKMLNCEQKYIMAEYNFTGDVIVYFYMSKLDRWNGEDIRLSVNGDFKTRACFNIKAKVFIDSNQIDITKVEFFDEKMEPNSFEVPGDIEDYETQDNLDVGFDI